MIHFMQRMIEIVLKFSLDSHTEGFVFKVKIADTEPISGKTANSQVPVVIIFLLTISKGHWAARI